MDASTRLRFADTTVLSVARADATIVVTSADIDARLQATYDRVGLRPGMLESLAGVRERRWWPVGTRFTDAAVMAGEAALAEAGIDPGRIGVLIDTSVCRERLEPSASVDIHRALGLPPSCINFDLGNACLGFLNGMHLASLLIDSGTVDYALVTDGEGSRRPQEVTLDRLASPTTTREDVMANFATFTLGSGGAAMVLGRASAHPEGHRLAAGISRAATEHNGLCIGDLDGMHTDSRGLLAAGVALAEDTWRDAAQFADWTDLDAYVIHQVSQVHTEAITTALAIDPTRVPVTFPTRGNIGPASIPFTMATHASSLRRGQRIACMGIGSGINAAVIELRW